MDIRPLTRSNKAGTLYYREAVVEQQIRSLGNLSDDEVLARARNQEKDSSEYIQEEALVYWIREYLYHGDSQRAGELAEILLVRCTKLIQFNLRRLRPDLAPQAEQDVVGDLFKDIFDLETDRGDFLQARFWLALDKRITGTFKRYVRDAARTEPLASPNEDSKPQGEDIIEDPDTREPTITGLTAEQRELIKDALIAIDEPYRTAFVLHHYRDWPIESKDSSVLTVSSYFKKDPRTIRYWLKRAEQALSEWRNEERS